MGLVHINPFSPKLTETESIAIIRMLEKREDYVRKGRAYEAHGAGTMILLLWNTLTEFRDTMPTGWDDL